MDYYGKVEVIKMKTNILSASIIINLLTLSSCEINEVTNPRNTFGYDSTWVAAPRISAGSLTKEQLEKAKLVRITASRNGSIITSKESPYEVGYVSLVIPTRGNIDIEISGLSQFKDTTYWYGISTIASGVSDAGVITLIAGPGLNPNSSITEKIVYGNQTYETVTIGNQVWMKKNLNYPGQKGDLGVCYNGEQRNCDKYGRLYTFAQATNGITQSTSTIVRGICPEGWHLPSQQEWDTLINYTEWDPRVGKGDAFIALRSTTDWVGVGGTTGIPIGTDIFGFSALPGGNRSSTGYFYNVGSIAYFWTSTLSNASAYSPSQPYAVTLNAMSSISSLPSSSILAFSVRCIKD